MIQNESKDWIEEAKQIDNFFKVFYQNLFTKDTYIGLWHEI